MNKGLIKNLEREKYDNVGFYKKSKQEIMLPWLEEIYGKPSDLNVYILSITSNLYNKQAPFLKINDIEYGGRMFSLGNILVNKKSDEKWIITRIFIIQFPTKRDEYEFEIFDGKKYKFINIRSTKFYDIIKI